MGKGVTANEHLAYHRLFNHRILCLHLLHTLLAQTDVEHAQLTDKDLVLGEQERQLGLLQGQRGMGADDVGTNIIGVVLGHQTRGHVDTDNLGRRGVDVFHQRGKATGQRFVEPRTEESVNHQHVGLQLGRVELFNHLHECFQLLGFLQPLLVGGTVGCKMPADIEKVSTHLIVLLSQQTRHGKGVAAIVSWSGKDNDRGCIRVFLDDGLSQRLSRTLHEIETRNGLVLDGVFVQLMYLSTSKYLHLTAKIRNNS